MKMRVFAIGASLALTAAVAQAEIVKALDGDIEVGSTEMPSDAYPNVGGMAAKTGLGECLRLGAWSEDNMVNGCEGIEEAEKEMAAVEEKPAEAPKPAEPKYTKKVDTRELSDMALFDVDSDQLNAAGLEAMDALMGKLGDFRKKDITSITVTGHADSTGDADYNMGLSERRAATIAALLRKSYSNATVTAIGKGEAEPVATNETAAGRQQNRRVEIDIQAEVVTFE